jgi:hypothetical protein
VRRLALLSVLAVAGCGSGGDETALLGPGEASRLDRQVELVGDRVAGGDCDGAERALARYAELVGQLPDRRDADLLAALRDGATQLETTIAADCEQPAEEETETATETETTPTETLPTTTTTTPTVTEPPATTQTTPVPTTTQPTTPTVPVPDTGEGGEGGAGDEDSGASGSGSSGSGSGGAVAPEDG